MLTESQRIKDERASDESPSVLRNSRIVSLIVYVDDLAESRTFYERKLGLRTIGEDTDSVKFDVGQVILCLNRARDHGITLSKQWNDSSDIVFLVDNVEGVRAALERRGVVFARRRTYIIGSVTDFYDPNGHRLMLYEPSQRSLMAPGANKVRAVWRASGRGGTELIGRAAVPVTANARDLEEWGLDGKPLIYFFLFHKDPIGADEFYERKLGLRVLQRTHCCNNCPGDIKGLVKYDAGGMIFSTHHLHGHHTVLDDYGQPYGSRDFEPEDAKGVASVFYVANIGRIVEELSKRGVRFSNGIVRARTGYTAKFDAPSGHLFYIYEPSTEAFTRPSGAKLKQILTAPI
jgi:catechol 2,3-dioxygenase-like lactoylglutathione lyase family enzyme